MPKFVSSLIIAQNPRMEVDENPAVVAEAGPLRYSDAEGDSAIQKIQAPGPRLRLVRKGVTCPKTTQSIERHQPLHLARAKGADSIAQTD